MLRLDMLAQNSLCHLARKQHAVAVEKDTDRARARQDRAVLDFSRAKAPIVVSDVVEAIENASGPGLDDARGRRAGPIVRDYHLEAFIGLSREATQHGIKPILAIIGRDDDGDEFG